MDAQTTADEEPEVEATSLSLPSRQRRRSSASITKTSNKRQQRREKKKKHVAVEKIAEAASAIPQPMRPFPLLVCSIGNPGAQYANTLHSAGHTVLNRLAERLGYPGFRKEKSWGNGLLSTNGSAAPAWTLWQSTSYMNESGKGVVSAYQRFLQQQSQDGGRMVVVYDELESPLGKVTLRDGSGSPRGHNGLKSIKAHIGGRPFWRIGVGIGRPVSRESDDVARYVLKKMDANDKRAIEGSVDEILGKLKGLAEG
ncbi:Peptidyl-tRNA hydrolase [Lecanosticta acicola]|uniref:peptidyl-tRNA hydrolase n=1 Tax=Lecanosticta acicola TaxID=111012 RepID=A0AAI9EE60_9PEZI|nr:Peptidyl-tRNA hydrolase [Lecanosticta acicola]